MTSSTPPPTGYRAFMIDSAAAIRSYALPELEIRTIARPDLS